MEDFSVTPELVASCEVHKNQIKELYYSCFFKAEIEKCNKDSTTEKHPGETIHCLMKGAMESDKMRESKDRSKGNFSSQCEELLVPTV